MSEPRVSDLLRGEDRLKHKHRDLDKELKVCRENWERVEKHMLHAIEEKHRLKKDIELLTRMLLDEGVSLTDILRRLEDRRDGAMAEEAHRGDGAVR